MNKIITILIFTSMAFSTYVQFNVDMSQQDVGEEYPTLWMGAFYPDPGFMMEDPDGDGVWSVLLELDPGIYTYKFRNGAWQDWNTGSGWEDLLGQDCAVGQWSDRQVVVGSENLQLDPVCFSSCSSDCVTVNSYEVTFQVDMNNVEGFNPSDGVYVQGTFNGWCGYCNPLSDDDGDYIYTLTIPVPESEYEFLFTTMGWDGLQGGAPIGSECDYLPDDEFGNYGFLLSGQDLVLDVIPFGACPGGGDTGGGDLLPSQVTFDLDGLDDCSFLSITGTWDNWSGWGANTDTDMSASIPAGDHEFVILCVDTAGEWWNDIWGSSTPYYAPIDGSCWNGNAEYPNYAFNVDGSGDSVTISYCAGTCDVTCNATECGSGDVNDDGGLNILDIVTMVNYILGNQTPSDDQICSSDFNGDGSLNILDIVGLVNVIMNPRGLESSQLIIFNPSINELNFETNGYVGAIQMTISHDESFTLNLTNKAFVAESKTENKLTKIILVDPQGGEVFKSEGNYNIESVIAASMDGYIETQINMPTEFMISNAFPNPFNPSTNISIELNTDSDVSLKVFNVMGQLVDILSEGKMSMGIHTITWNASNFPTGIYIVNSSINGNSQFQKIMLLK